MLLNIALLVASVTAPACNANCLPGGNAVHQILAHGKRHGSPNGLRCLPHLIKASILLCIQLLLEPSPCILNGVQVWRVRRPVCNDAYAFVAHEISSGFSRVRTSPIQQVHPVLHTWSRWAAAALAQNLTHS